MRAQRSPRNEFHTDRTAEPRIDNGLYANGCWMDGERNVSHTDRTAGPGLEDLITPKSELAVCSPRNALSPGQEIAPPPGIPRQCTQPIKDDSLDDNVGKEQSIPGKSGVGGLAPINSKNSPEPVRN